MPEEAPGEAVDISGAPRWAMNRSLFKHALVRRLFLHKMEDMIGYVCLHAGVYGGRHPPCFLPSPTAVSMQKLSSYEKTGQGITERANKRTSEQAPAFLEGQKERQSVVRSIDLLNPDSQSPPALFT